MILQAITNPISKTQTTIVSAQLPKLDQYCFLKIKSSFIYDEGESNWRLKCKQKNTKIRNINEIILNRKKKASIKLKCYLQLLKYFLYDKVERCRIIQDYKSFKPIICMLTSCDMMYQPISYDDIIIRRLLFCQFKLKFIIFNQANIYF